MILCERQISWKCWVIVYRLPFLSLANEFPGNCRCLKLSCIKWDRSIEILGRSFLWECFADTSIFVVVSHGRWSEAFPFSRQSGGVFVSMNSYAISIPCRTKFFGIFIFHWSSSAVMEICAEFPQSFLEDYLKCFPHPARLV